MASVPGGWDFKSYWLWRTGNTVSSLTKMHVSYVHMDLAIISHEATLLTVPVNYNHAWLSSRPTVHIGYCARTSTYMGIHVTNAFLYLIFCVVEGWS